MVDLLREYPRFRVPPDEFRLIRDPDGISSLEHAIVNDWSLHGADRALKRFRQLVRVLGRRRVKFVRYGLNWNRNCGGEFFRISDDYINSLIELKYGGHSIHDYYEAGDLGYIRMKVAERLRSLRTGPIWMAGTGDGFHERTKTYFARLFDALTLGEAADAVVLNQGASATRPQAALNYVHNGYVIVVERDPRDVYVESKRQHLAVFIPRSDPHAFSQWYRRHRLEAVRLTRAHPRILHVQFEQLVSTPESTISTIERFLELPPGRSRAAGQGFDPELSARNVGMWQRHRPKKEIAVLERELGAYLWHGRTSD